MHFHPATVQSRTPSPLGPVRLAASPLGLVGLWFEGQRHQPMPYLDGPGAWLEVPGHSLMQEAAAQL